MAKERIEIDVNVRNRKAVDQLNDSLKRARVSASGVGRGLAAIAGVGLGFAAVGRAIGNVVRVTRTYEQSIANVAGITRASAAEIEAFEKAARGLGRTTRFSASQAAGGLEFLARAGFSANQSIAGLPATLSLAVAAGLDLARAADIASNVLIGFRLGIDQFGRVGDVLALAAASANTNVDQLGHALRQVAPVSASLNVSLEETTAVLGALGDAGIQASRAGTNLRGILATLNSAPKLNKLADLGIDVADLDVSVRGLIPVLRTLRDANLSTTEAFNVFGLRNTAAVFAILDNVDAIGELNTELQAAEGFSKETAVTMDDNLNGAVLGLNSQWEEFLITIGQSDGLLRGTVDTLRDVLSDINDLIADASRSVVEQQIDEASAELDAFLAENAARRGSLTGETGFLGVASRRSADETAGETGVRLRTQEGEAGDTYRRLLAEFEAVTAAIAAGAAEERKATEATMAATEATMAATEATMAATEATMDQTPSILANKQQFDALVLASQLLAKRLASDADAAALDASIAQRGSGGRSGADDAIDFAIGQGPESDAGGSSQFATALGDNLARTLGSVDFSNVGDSLTDNLKQTFLSSFATTLPDIFAELATKALDALGRAFSGGEGGGFKLPFFHDGGLFQSGNASGQGLAVLRDGERVLTPGQQRGGSAGTTVNLNLSADASRQTRREVMRYSRDIGSTIRQEEREYAV